MLHFAQPLYLFLILVIPFFYLLYALYRRGRNKRITKFGTPELVDKLMPERSKSIGWVKLTCFSLAWLFLMLGLARPQIGAKLKESDDKGSEIMIALDVSNSMLARDYSPNRLERAKMDIAHLVNRLHNDRIGLVVFAGQSFVQLPITADYVSANIFLNSISTSSVPIQGTAIGEAIETCAKSFSEEGMAGKDNKAIIVITDGENHEDDAVAAAQSAREAGIRVYCIGVGTPQGQPIPMAGGGLMKDKEGNIVVTKLDEPALQEIAKAGDGVYVKAGDAEFGLDVILDKIRDLSKQSYKALAFEEYDEQFMYFLAIALAFLLLEFLIGDRKLGKKIFMFAVLFLTISTQGFAQRDKKQVSSGNRYFGKSKFKQAEVEYRKGLLRDSTSVLGRGNLANTLYRMKDADNATKLFEGEADTVGKLPFNLNWNGSDKTIVRKKYSRKDIGKPSNISKFFFNAGSNYLVQKQYDKAAEMFKQSLVRNPSDMMAKANYVYAKKMAQNQQNQNKNNKNNKDRDKNQNKNNQNKNNQGNNNQNQNKNNQGNNNQNQNQNNKNNNQNKNQNQNNQNKQNPQQQPQGGGQQPKMSRQNAQQMLQAIQDKENQTQQKVQKARAVAAKSRQKEKNW
ncbi:MAG: VWA domain-containing protein [Bacteroidales bacterium]|nr:VWA domain-containing protein [Bacteroidales bacterium]